MAITPNWGINSSFTVSDGFANYEFKVKDQDEVIKYSGIDVTLFIPFDIETEEEIKPPNNYVQFSSATEMPSLAFIFSNFSNDVFGKNICTGGASGASIGLETDVNYNDFADNISYSSKNHPAFYDFSGEA